MRTLREHMGIRLVTDAGVNQIRLGNKTGVTWVPGVRAVKLRYDRAWAKVILGQQSLRLSWGVSPADVDKTDDG